MSTLRPTDQSTKETIKKKRGTDKVNKFMPTEVSITVNGKMTRSTDKVFTLGPTVQSTKEAS